MLLAGLHAEGATSVTEPAATRDHTERALAAFGGRGVRRRPDASRSTDGQRLEGRTLQVPGDFSSAAFWLVAAAAMPGSRVEIEEVGLNPTRTGLLERPAPVRRARAGRRLPSSTAESRAARSWSKYDQDAPDHHRAR